MTGTGQGMADVDVLKARFRHGHRAERRARYWLREWLAEPAWSLFPRGGDGPPWPTAMALLAGVNPDSSWPEGLWLLPGAAKAYGFGEGRHPEEVRAAHRHLAERVARLLAVDLQEGNPREEIAPAEAVRRAVAAGVDIPWLPVARWDKACRPLLPREALGEEAESEAPEAPMKRPPREWTKAWAADVAGREAFVSLRAQKFPKRCRLANGRLSKEGIAGAMRGLIAQRFKDAGKTPNVPGTRALLIRLNGDPSKGQEAWLQPSDFVIRVDLGP